MQEEIQTILGKYSSSLTKQLYIYHVVLHFDATLFIATLGIVDIYTDNFIRYPAWLSISYPVS